MEDVIKAAIEGKTETPTPTGQTVPDPKAAAPQTPTPSGQAEKAPNLEGQNDWEYDGNIEKVPAQFQKFAKGLQKHFTQRSMTDAEIRRKGQEYDTFVTSEDFKNYQTWKQQNSGQPGQAPGAAQPQPENPTLINQQEWEDAQLDPTGMKAQALIDRVVQARLGQAIQQYGGQLQQLQHTQQRTEFNSALSDYADANPEVLELHEMGLMKPRIEEELASRKHKTWESAINAAHTKAAEARDIMKARLLKDQTELVQKKKDAVIEAGSGTGEQTIVHVDKNDAFNTAFENAAAGKKVKNKLK
jgi:hypothetical protein